AGSVELREFEIPLIYLEKVEFHACDRFELDVAFLNFIKKQGEEIGFKVFRGIGFGFFVILKGFSQVHKTQFVTQRMKKLLLIAFSLIESCLKSIKGHLVNDPFKPQSFRL